MQYNLNNRSYSMEVSMRYNLNRKGCKSYSMEVSMQYTSEHHRLRPKIKATAKTKEGRARGKELS